mgnify:CR=1 FL=1
METEQIKWEIVKNFQTRYNRPSTYSMEMVREDMISFPYQIFVKGEKGDIIDGDIRYCAETRSEAEHAYNYMLSQIRNGEVVELQASQKKGLLRCIVKNECPF